MQIKLIIFLLLFCSTVPALAQTDRADELYRKAMQLKKEGKCTEVIGLLKTAIELRPGFQEAYYELGWCYNELQQYQLALEILKKARNAFPNDYRIIYEAGLAKSRLALTEEALLDYNQAILLNPSFARVYVARADLYRESKDSTNKALADYLLSIQYDSASVKAYYWIGWCYNDLGLYNQAMPWLQKAIQVDKQNDLCYSEIGFSLYSIGKYTEAVEFLNRANQLRPKLETTIYYLGICAVKLNKKADAVKQYNELSMLGSEYAISLLNEIKNMK